MSDTTGKAYFGDVDASEEELQAFSDAYSLHQVHKRERDIITGSCLAAFLAGYRAKVVSLLRDLNETRSDLAAELAYPHEWDTNKFPSLESAALLHIRAQRTVNPSIIKARGQLTKELEYPEKWDTAAYPTLEEALVETLTTSKLSGEERCYSMNQMRDYADGMTQTRHFYLFQRLKLVAGEWDALAAKFEANTSIPSAQAETMRSCAQGLRAAINGLQTMMPKSFQKRAGAWAVECFGSQLGSDPKERNHRFFEEATELVQACGMTENEAIAAVKYVFARPIGDKLQEIGGVMTTLAVLCHVQGINMMEAAEIDLLEISVPEKRDAIAAKRMTKPDFSAQSQEESGFDKAAFLSMVKEYSPAIFEMLTGRGMGERYLSQEGRMIFGLVKELLNKVKK